MTNMGIDKTKVYMDFKGFDQLRLAAKEDSPEALKQVAKKFEAIFMQMVMKSMRSANTIFKDDNFLNSESTEFYEEMFDKQLAMNLTEGRGLGLSDVLVRQLSRGGQVSTDAARQNEQDKTGLTITKASKSETVMKSEVQASEQKPLIFDSPVDFVKSLWNDAVEIAKKINLDPKMLIAQAALETGWGKSIIKANNGQSSYNLFNIKADKSWEKEHVSVNTLEYENGIAVKTVAPFRKYIDFSESFSDYVNFLKSFSRYTDALASSGDPKAYIQELQKAGYATDPNYADKVYSIYESDTMKNALKQLEVD